MNLNSVKHNLIDKEKFVQQAKAAKAASQTLKAQKAASVAKKTSDSVALSQKSKQLAQASALNKTTATTTATQITTRQVDAPSIEAPEISGPSIEIPNVEAPSIEIPKIDAPKVQADDLRQAKKLDPKKSVEQIGEKKFGDVEKPAVFFVSGFDWWGAGSIIGDYDGVRDMAEAVEGARHYAWDQKDEMITEIMKRKSNQKIALIGHSLGGDTVMEIAQELNTLDKSFRKVDLLVTLDATGMDNDIVPTNVARNINVFGENHLFYNDGPHVARDAKRTVVSNELSPLDHTELDDSAELQEQLLHAINTAIG
jgi:hypothetical protein